jgi:hypothetical protein
MRSTILGTSFAICLALAAPVRGDDQVEMKALIDKAIKAMGGEDKVLKYKAVTGKGKGTIYTPGEVTFTEESSWQPPKQYRFDMELDFGNAKVKQVFVFNGDKGWLKLGEKTEDMPKEMFEAFNDYFLALRAGLYLAELKADGVKLSPLGEVKVDDKPALGVQVSRKGLRDINLYFDKESGLPVKSEVTAKEVFGGDQEVLHEFFFSEFKNFDGARVFTKMVWVRDGKKYLERDVTEIKGMDKIEEGTFGKP